MKGLNNVLGLTFVQKYSQLKPETWLRPFMNTAPAAVITIISYKHLRG